MDYFPGKDLSTWVLLGIDPDGYLNLWGYVSCIEQTFGIGVEGKFQQINPNFTSLTIFTVYDGGIKGKEGVDMVLLQ